MLAMYTSPVARSPVIWTSRKKVVVTCPSLVQVAPLSVEKRTKRAPPPRLKSFQETYIRPKNGEDGLLSAQPDSRSAEDSLKTPKWVQLLASAGAVDLYPPR